MKLKHYLVFTAAFLCIFPESHISAADSPLKPNAKKTEMSQTTKLVNEGPFELDGWPFTVRTFQTPQGYTVVSFLRNMPVSHEYKIDSKTFQSQQAAGKDPLKQLQELARADLKQGLYKTWIIHWASQ